MAKNYTLDKSASTGWWTWACKDGSAGGSAPSKGQARDLAKNACGDGGGLVTPPDVNAHVLRGYLASFTVADLDGKKITYSTQEISEAQFAFFFGLPCGKDEKIDKVDKVIAVLKIWGIYRGGLNAETIKKLHFLSDDDYGKLAERNYFGGSIIVEDDRTIRWNLPK